MSPVAPPPFPFPVFSSDDKTLFSGFLIQPSSFCSHSFNTKRECIEHYKSLATRSEGYFECPFGMTSRSFYVGGKMYVATAMVGYPRFGSRAEREIAKKYPAIKVDRRSIESSIKYLQETDRFRAELIQEGSQVLPQAFHELRKLNGAVLQTAERELKENKGSAGLKSIISASELMRNNFDVLEALSNPDVMRAIPLDGTINLFDLAYKARSVYLERAATRHIQIDVDGVRAIVRGSQKSFPIVTTVLFENAVKYAKPHTHVQVEITAPSNRAILTVENETEHPIDPGRCFEKGVRFSKKVEGGGFGLYLAREIVQVHNGTISCDASDGKVRMSVELPLLNVVPKNY